MQNQNQLCMWNQCQRAAQIEHRHLLGRMIVRCCHCNGYMFLEEQFAQSSHHNPHFQLRCKEGKINLPPIQPLLAEYMVLLTENIEEKHNIAFAFTSSGANFDWGLANGWQGVYMWWVQGSFHHLILHWIPEDCKLPCFAHIYICNNNAQVNYWLNLNDAFNAPIVQMLTRLLNQHNHYAVNYVPNLEQLQMQNMQHEIHIQPIQHIDAHYDLPTGRKLAAIIPYSSLENEAISENRDIIFHKHIANGIQLQWISQLHPSYDLHFVRLHFIGENGLADSNCHAAGAGKTVTQQQYYSYRMMIWDGDFTQFQFSGCLSQEYAVDNFCKIEEARLNWHRHSQAQLWK